MISILMPTYNAEKYIGFAIESVLGQSYTDWELIIVDDNSSDNTWEIVKSYDDSRIFCKKRDTNSGCAYVPRKEALYLSKGNWILFLDSDDLIEPDYITTLYSNIMDNNADICLGRMLFVFHPESMVSKDTIGKIPDDTFDFSYVYTGKEAFKLTIPVWKIGLNGSLIKREIWLKSIEEFENNTDQIDLFRNDEALSRIQLLLANNVLITEGKYFYRLHESTSSNDKSKKAFDEQISLCTLCKATQRLCGTDSEEYKMAEIGNFRAFISGGIRFFSSIGIEFTDFYSCYKRWYNNIDWKVINKYNDGYYVIFRRFNIYIYIYIYNILHSKI